MAERKYFNIVRYIAIAAIACTLAAIIFMIVESAFPGDISAAASAKFTGDKGDTVVVDQKLKDVPTKRIAPESLQGYIGQDKAITVYYSPSEATDRDIEWEIVGNDVADPVFTLSDDGVVHFLRMGNANVRATLKSDPEITATCNVTCYGTHPEKITSLTPKVSTFKSGTNSQFYLTDQDGEDVSVIPYTATYSDGGEHFVIQHNQLIARKPGTATLTLSHKSMPQDISMEITITENPNYVPIEKLSIKEGLLDEDGYYNLPIYSYLSANEIFDVTPANATSTYVKLNSSSSSIQVIVFRFQAVTTGEATLRITPLVDPSKAIDVKIRVYVPKPQQIQIMTNSVTTVDSLTDISVYGDDSYIDPKDIAYTVVKGKATFENGRFRGKRLGKLVIKATYLPDPTLTATAEIDIKLYTTFGQFIRKILGHFTLFCVIGFGLTFVYLFGIKPRWVSLPLTLSSGLLLGMLSEGIQSLTKGRYASWVDVFVDATGAALGMVIAFAVFGLILLVAHLLGNKGKLWNGVKAVTFRTMFKRFSPATEPAAATPDGATQEVPVPDGATIDDPAPAENVAANAAINDSASDGATKGSTSSDGATIKSETPNGIAPADVALAADIDGETAADSSIADETPVVDDENSSDGQNG